ncbi:MAG: glycosyltransferase [bacterium]
MKVSVWMSAYNHQDYIAQCLDSVLNQKTDFEFDIVLGEDCSADRTREIVNDYKNKYPDKFKLYLPEKNIGMMAMDIATWKMCTGEYVALLNGDDYWTDENKLQTQVNFLEENRDAVMCFHKAKVENETDGSSFETVYLESDDILPAESLLRGYNPIMTPTVMIRNILEIPEGYLEMPYGDMPLYLILSGKGKIKYIDKMMSVYRIHSKGNWQGDSVYNNLLKDLKFYEVMNKMLEYKYDELIKKIFTQRYFDLVICSIRQNNFEQAKIFFNELTLCDKDFLKSNEKEISIFKKILYEDEDKNNYDELLNREVKWKVN